MRKSLVTDSLTDNTTESILLMCYVHRVMPERTNDGCLSLRMFQVRHLKSDVTLLFEMRSKSSSANMKTAARRSHAAIAT